MKNWGECYYDHFEKFLGEPQGREGYAMKASSDRLIQIARYEGVWEGCVAYCSLGLTHFESEIDGVAELCAVVEGGHDEVPRLLANAEFFMIDKRMKIGWGMAVGGLEAIAPAFVAETGKEAIYVTSADGRLAEGFETVPCGTRTGAVYMAVFISKSEFSFFKKHGAEALEKRMEDARSDPFTLTRPSII